MKQLMILAALAALIYVFFLSGKQTSQDDKPEVIYQQQLEKAEQLEDGMQEALDQRMQSVSESGDVE